MPDIANLLTEDPHTRLRNALEKALEIGDDHKIISAVQKLLDEDKPELRQLAYAGLKTALDYAMKAGNDRTIIATAQKLIDAQVPELEQYVRARFAHYERTAKEKAYVGDKIKEVNSRIRYAIEKDEDGRLKVTSYSVEEKSSLRKWFAIGGIAAGIAAAIIYFSLPSEAVPQKEPAYSTQK